MSDHIVECTTTDNRVLHGARVRENHRQRQSSTPRSDLQIRLKVDGNWTFTVEYAEQINYVTDLGLLEAAKHDLYERLREEPPPR